MCISIVIIARNEEVNIGRCLSALRWCTDVLVVDDRSDDRTRAIAEGFGVRVKTHAFRSFADQRNWAIEHGDLRHEWVLLLDADEVVTEDLRREIEQSIALVDWDTAAFAICRKTMFDSRWLRYSDDFPVWIMRLIRRSRAQFVDSGHGEVPLPEVEGVTHKLHSPIIHYPFSKGISDWLQRHDRYSSREAELELAQTVDFRWRDLLSRDRSVRRRTLRNASRRLPGRPFGRFLYQYIFCRGFLEGRAGLTYSVLMAAYEGMIVLKRRELEASLKLSDTWEPHPLGELAEASGPGQAVPGSLAPSQISAEVVPCDPVEANLGRTVL